MSRTESSPECDEGKHRVLIFSRGRGSGHAIPDLEIGRLLHELRDDIQLAFVSYGTGARTIAEHQFPLIDLDLPESGDLAELTVRAGKLISRLQPDLVVAHEEFAVLAPAKIFDKPTVYMTDFFVEPSTAAMLLLAHADLVLFLGEPGLFQEPPAVAGRVRYVGRVLRQFKYATADRSRARSELELDELDTVISVLPGSWTEEMAPIFDLILEAFDDADLPSKRMIWLAGADCEQISAQVSARKEITVLDHDWRIDRIFVASDMCVTKANRMTSLELDAFAVPSIALSPGKNRIDDHIVRSLPSVSFVPPGALDPAQLARTMERLCRETRPPAPSAETLRGGLQAARAISSLLPRKR